MAAPKGSVDYYKAIAAQDARKVGINPDFFVRQIGAESGFRPGARSGAGAQGIAQIMPATARGWHVNPNDPEAALAASAKAMAHYVKSYGGYRNALVAYNAGPARVGGPLPSETKAYIAKIMGGSETAPAVASAVASVPGAATTRDRFSDQQKAMLAAAFDSNPHMQKLLGILGSQKVDVVRPTPGAAGAVATGAGGGPQGQQLVATALAQVGKTANDAMKYIHAAGGKGYEAWCGDFVQWVFQQRGLKPPPARSVPALMAWAKTNHKIVTNPQAGDLVTFDWNGDGKADHVELVRGRTKGGVTTIGGNTSMQGGGIGVAAKTRTSNILGYVRAT